MKSATTQLPPLRWKLVRPAPPPETIIFGRPARGVTTIPAIAGNLDTGLRTRKTGFGFPHAMFGRRRAAFICRAAGTSVSSAAAACCPVYFSQPVYLRPNYVYRPWCALNTPNLFVHLWVRPNYGHFYFGNYYGSNWATGESLPACQYRPYRNCYDPVLTQLQCHYRQSGVNYINRLDGWHNHYASNVSSRPPRTWNEQVRIVNNVNINKTKITNVKQNLLAVNLQDASKRNDMTMKFARLDGNMQKQAINLSKETRDVRQHRITVERPAGLATDLTKENGKAGGKRPDGNPSVGQRGPRPGNNEVRMKLPTTVVADAIKQNDKHAPPKLTRPDHSQPRVE